METQKSVMIIQSPKCLDRNNIRGYKNQEDQNQRYGEREWPSRKLFLKVENGQGNWISCEGNSAGPLALKNI